MEDTRLSDQQLIDRMVRGDDSALAELFALHSPRAYAIALRVLKDGAEAEEVVQDAFIEVWKSATRYNPERAAPDRWVSTIVRTRSIDRLRKREARERLADSAQHVPAQHRPSPEEQHGRAEAAVQLRTAMATLPPDQRMALELAYYEGLSQSDIAEKTGTALGTVKTRMRLALIKLAQAIPPR